VEYYRAQAGRREATGIKQKKTEGTRLVYNKMLNMLEKYKVATFGSVDKEFDTDYHDALLIKVDNKKPDRTVVEEFEKGL